MSIIFKIEDDFKTALKNKDELKISTIRLLKTAIHNFEIAAQREAKDEDIWQLVNNEVKKRKESVLAYQSAGRKELSEKEEKEILILKNYQPREPSKEEIDKKIDEIIEQTNAKGLGDFGLVMKEAMLKYKGQVDGGKIAEVVKKKLGA